MYVSSSGLETKVGLQQDREESWGGLGNMAHVPVYLTVVLNISSIFVVIIYMGGSLEGFSCVIVKRR